VGTTSRLHLRHGQQRRPAPPRRGVARLGLQAAAPQARCRTRTANRRSRQANHRQRIVAERGYLNLRLGGEDVAEFFYIPGKCSRAYRIVVVRKNISHARGEQVLFDEIRHFFYVTTRRDPSTRQIVQLANERRDQEGSGPPPRPRKPNHPQNTHDHHSLDSASRADSLISGLERTAARGRGCRYCTSRGSAALRRLPGAYERLSIFARRAGLTRDNDELRRRRRYRDGSRSRVGKRPEDREVSIATGIRCSALSPASASSSTSCESWSHHHRFETYAGHRARCARRLETRVQSQVPLPDRSSVLQRPVRSAGQRRAPRRCRGSVGAERAKHTLVPFLRTCGERRAASGERRALPRPTKPPFWMPPTSTSGRRSCWSGTISTCTLARRCAS
jgi:hypothetical protein